MSTRKSLATLLAALALGLGLVLAVQGARAHPAPLRPAPAACDSFAPVPSMNGGASANVLRSIAVIGAADAWAVGDAVSGSADRALAEHWDGSQWAIVPAPDPGPSVDVLDGVAALAPDDVWAVGYADTGGSYQTLVEHWDGSTWTVVSSPNPGSSNLLRGITAGGAADLWAVG
ncbi:MAG TPA: hypothetical protein VKY74_03070, partial [Chloroflexia bacterium]|nr:hypothetical protein [Chloroflexia bacterium]